MKRNKNKIYANNYSSLIMTFFIAIVIYFCIAMFITDEFSKNFITIILIPFLIPTFLYAFNKMDVLKQTYIDIEIYNSTEKIPSDSVVWYDMNHFHSGTYCCIENIGQTLISYIEIIVNPLDPKTDKYYYLEHPINSQDKYFIKLPIARKNIKRIFVICYSSFVDKPICFSGNFIDDHSCWRFSNVTAVKGYNTKKIKNPIELRRNFIANIK